MTTALSVNINKIALLRNQRNIAIPSPVSAAQTILNAGANGITVHPRPDQRHIRDSDSYELAEFIHQYNHERVNKRNVEFNIEGKPNPHWLKLVKEIQPDQATLVPDADDAFTSDQGWDVITHFNELQEIIHDLKSHDIRVSLFIETDIEQIMAASQVGADRIELYTGPYAQAFEKGFGERSVASYKKAAIVAQESGLGVNAGHDLNLENLKLFSQTVAELDEVSIGHAFIADTLWFGLENTVQKYQNILNTTSP